MESPQRAQRPGSYRPLDRGCTMATPDGWATAAPQLHAVRAAHRSHGSWPCVHWPLQWRGLAFDRLWQHLAPTATLFETNSPHAASAMTTVTGRKLGS